MTVDGLGYEPWGEDENARRYHEFTRQYPVYQQSSRDLITLALLSKGAAAVDLACGTGVTTKAILDALGPDGRVTGVDGSAAMLAIAASSVSDNRVTWTHAHAEHLDRYVTGFADTVVCNAAIWQTDLDATMIAVRKVMAAQGRFVFNIGSQFLEDEEVESASSDPLSATVQGLAMQNYNWTPPLPEPSNEPRLSQALICQHLDHAGFDLERVEHLEYEYGPDVRRAWLSVPVFTERLLPGLPYELRMAALDRAYEQLGPGEPSVSRWVVFAAKAR